MVCTTGPTLDVDVPDLPTMRHHGFSYTSTTLVQFPRTARWAMQRFSIGNIGDHEMAMYKGEGMEQITARDLNSRPDRVLTVQVPELLSCTMDATGDDNRTESLLSLE